MGVGETVRQDATLDVAFESFMNIKRDLSIRILRSFCPGLIILSLWLREAYKRLECQLHKVVLARIVKLCRKNYKEQDRQDRQDKKQKKRNNRLPCCTCIVL